MSATNNSSHARASRLAWDGNSIERYRRHFLLDEIGYAGQEKIASSSVLVVGAGGLGSPVITYLAAAGVGKIGVVDGDRVELSNLQRQVLFFTCDIDKSKALVSQQRIREINPEVEVEAYDVFLRENNAASLIRQYDFVCESSDNYDTKLLVNDTCVREHKPFTIGSLSRFEGQVMTHIEGSACWRCLYGCAPANQDGRAAEGVLGTVPGIAGSIEASEAVKFITGAGSLLTNRLLCFDALQMEFHTFDFGRNPGCPVCGRGCAESASGVI